MRVVIVVIDVVRHVGFLNGRNIASARYYTNTLERDARACISIISRQRVYKGAP